MSAAWIAGAALVATLAAVWVAGAAYSKALDAEARALMLERRLREMERRSRPASIVRIEGRRPTLPTWTDLRDPRR